MVKHQPLKNSSGFKRTLVTLLTVVTMMTVLPTNAGFDWDISWGDVYIAAVNQTDTTPDFSNAIPTAPDDFTVSLPLTIKVSVRMDELWDHPVNHVELQYKVEGTSVWYTLDPLYYETERAYDFKANQNMMGREIIKEGMPGITYGETIYVRLYIANQDVAEPYENAPKANDTTADGSGGWHDEWVVRFQLDTTERPRWE